MPTAQLLEQAQRATASGANDEAISLLESALAREPDNPQILNMLANRVAAAGDGEAACTLIERALRIDPRAAPLWLNLANAERQRGDAAGEERALNRALEIEPYLVPALLQKGELCERADRRDDASQAYSAALTIVGQFDSVPPGLQPRLERARAFVDRRRSTLVRDIRAAADQTRASSERFDRFVRVFNGEERNYLPQPTRLYYAGLPADYYFDSTHFPWFGELEAETDAVRDELLAVMATSAGMRPYIDIAPTMPVNQWDKLNRSLDWSAYFLWENGRRIDEHCVACPKTAALVERLPLFDVPGHAPTAMFSILKPGAHIPPHTGDTNIRAVVHLPLVVPPGCEFRVGADCRPWVEGKAWAFDDTVEHEAWNRSDQARAILIVDTWNPHLREDERTLLRASERVLKAGTDAADRRT